MSDTSSSAVADTVTSDAATGTARLLASLVADLHADLQAAKTATEAVAVETATEAVAVETATEAVAVETASEGAPRRSPRPRSSAPRVPAVKRARASSTEMADFTTYLATLGQPSTPKLHVNGAQFGACILTVDFGQPLVRSPKLTTEQSGEFVNRLRTLARAVLGREANIRVSHDGQTGIYWTSAS